MHHRAVSHGGAHRMMLLAADIIALVAATTLATAIRFGDLLTTVNLENLDYRVAYYELSLAAAVLWIVVFSLEGLYDLDRLSWGFGEFGRAARALSIGVAVMILLGYVLKLPGLSRGWVLLTLALSVAFVFLGRLGVHLAVSTLRRRGRMLHPTMLLGGNAEARHLAEVLKDARPQGLDVVGCVGRSETRGHQEDCAGLPLLGDVGDLSGITSRERIDTAVIASSAFNHEEMAQIVSELRKLGVRVHVPSGLYEVLTSRVLVREISGVPFVTLKPTAFTPAQRVVKRVFDVCGATAVVLLGLPLWVAVSLAIAVTSRGPVFYVQSRVGRNGRPFGMLKFRSMVVDAASQLPSLDASNEADGPLFKMRDDPRVTKVGRWMRKYSIDEFPQLLNVLRGNMSLVGPRPPLPSEVEAYGEDEWRRMEVLPGMTGLWQVSGRSDLSFDEMVRLDVFYIENWSVGFDLAILAKTLPAVVLARGAY